MNGVGVAVISDPGDFFVSMLIFGMIVPGFAFLLTMGISRIHGRKEQFIFTIFLIFAAMLCCSIPSIFPWAISEILVRLCICAGFLIIPLAIITPGILWFWPDKRKNRIWDTLICSFLTLILGGLLYQGILLVVPVMTFVSSIQWLLTVLSNNPGGIQLVFLLLFVIVAVLSSIGYRIIGILKNKVPALTGAIPPANR